MNSQNIHYSQLICYQKSNIWWMSCSIINWHKIIHTWKLLTITTSSVRIFSHWLKTDCDMICSFAISCHTWNSLTEQKQALPSHSYAHKTMTKFVLLWLQKMISTQIWIHAAKWQPYEMSSCYFSDTKYVKQNHKQMYTSKKSDLIIWNGICSWG